MDDEPLDIKDLNLDDLLMADDTELDFKLDDFAGYFEEKVESKYCKPKVYKLECKPDYKYAKQLAEDLKLYPGELVHCMVAGSFIFGDFIEALLVEKDVVCTEMLISTLSMSQNNIDSLAGLRKTGHLTGKLTIMLSNYFYSHEKFSLIPYALENLDCELFDMLVIRNHTKLCLMKVANIHLVITGSANLRSSNCIEQFTIHESPELYAFYKSWFESLSKYSIKRNEH